MVRRTTQKKAGSVSVNFKGVEIGGQKRIPEANYLMRVAELTQEEGDKGDYLKWVFKVDEGKHKGATFYVNTSLTPQSLWKLGALLQALGHEVPDDELDLDLDDYIDETLMGVVADEVYEGKKRSRMVDFYSADDADAEGDEPEEKPAKESSRKAKDEDEEDEKPARKSRRRSKDEDDDEEEAPKSKRGAKKSKFSPIASDDVQEMDEDELQDVIDRSGVDVDLDDYSTLRKKRAAVIDALEAADLIDDDGEEETEEDDRPTRGKKKPAAKDEEDDEPEEDSAAARRKARRAARKSRG